jgi:hypothetical protein
MKGILIEFAAVLAFSDRQCNLLRREGGAIDADRKANAAGL